MHDVAEKLFIWHQTIITRTPIVNIYRPMRKLQTWF